jgi:hypothetical protein
MPPKDRVAAEKARLAKAQRRKRAGAATETNARALITSAASATICPTDGTRADDGLLQAARADGGSAAECKSRHAGGGPQRC